jgi:hypothetical protein
LSERTESGLTAMIAIAVTVVLAFQFWYVGRISRKLQDTYDAISEVSLRPDFRAVSVRDVVDSQLGTPIVKGYSRPRLFPVHEVLRYLPYYLRTERHMTGPVLRTSIIQSSLRYRLVLSNIKTMRDPPSAIVILGLQSHNREIASILPDQYERVKDKQYVMVLQLKTWSGDVQH